MQLDLVELRKRKIKCASNACVYMHLSQDMTRDTRLVSSYNILLVTLSSPTANVTKSIENNNDLKLANFLSR